MYVGDRELPDALIIGPQKAGTTWIHEYLHARGDVGLPKGVKETFFFDRRYDRGIEWYAKHFRHVGSDARRIVEVAPSYFYHSDAPDRIYTVLGRVPVVCTLRDPVLRAFSLFLHFHRFGIARGTFREAVNKHSQILESSRYAFHLARWTKCFGARSVKILLLESLTADPQQYAARLCSHLGLSEGPVCEQLRTPVNAAASPPNKTIARIAKRMSDSLRSGGFYGVVNAAKALGVKEVIFGRPGTTPLPELSDEDARWFGAMVASEVHALEQDFGVDTSLWTRYQSCAEIDTQARSCDPARGD